MTEETLSNFLMKLNELSITKLEKSVLMEMKSLVMNSEKQVLIHIIRHCSLIPVFGCLNSPDEEQIDLSCVIIYNLLKNMNADECLANYHKSLQKALCHPSPRIKTTVLTLLNDMIDEENIETISSQYPSLLLSSTECVGNSERSVAQGAITLFSNIGATPQGLGVLYSETLLENFREVMNINDIARFRVFEIVSNASRKSEIGLEKSKESGLISLLLEEVKSSDALLQLNALEILSSLGSCSHGYKYLQESGVIEYLTDKILKLFDNEPMAFVLLPGLIEFFGNICKEDPQSFINSHPEIINLLFQCLETDDEVLLGVVFSTMGKIGSTANGKLVLNTQEEHMKVYLKKAGEILGSKNDTTVSVLNSLTELFTISPDSEDELNNVLMMWFDKIGPEALDRLVNLTHLPFIELRLAALNMINAIAKLPWGAGRLCQYPGLIEYLTDRSTEFHKDCKSAKYDIIVSLSESPVISNYITDENLIRLKGYVKEGPFYVPTMSPEMMTEGAS